jgi:putative peptidoglycan lipid II flippase
LTEKRQILRSASIITVATVISRICGYLRDQRITLLLGTSFAADCFILAFRIPNTLRRLVGEGSMSASFIPVFAGYLKQGPNPEAWRFAERVFWIVALVAAAITALGAIFSRQVIAALTILAGPAANWNFAVYLNRIILPYIFIVSLVALAGAILNSLHVFGLPAASPILFNVSMIVFSLGVVYRPIMSWAPVEYRSPAVALAIGVLVGGSVQLAVLLRAVYVRGMRFRPQISLSDPGVRSVGRLMIPGFLGIGVYQINFFLNTVFATSRHLPAGSVTSLYVADRVMELTLGCFAIAVSTAILPMLSRQAVAGRIADMRKTFAFALRMVLFVTIPAAAGLILLREPIVQVLFQHGKFSAQSTALTSRALLYYSLGLPGFAGIKLVAPLFYSLKDTATPVRIGACALVLNIVLNLIFIARFSGSLSNGGPALATSISGYVNFSVLLAIFRLRFGQLGARSIARSVGKIAICSAVMAGGCAFALRHVPFEALGPVLWQAAALAAMIVGSIGVYLGLAWAFRCEELSEAAILLRPAEAASAF